jgi:hypothetical protein
VPVDARRATVTELSYQDLTRKSLRDNSIASDQAYHPTVSTSAVPSRNALGSHWGLLSHISPAQVPQASLQTSDTLAGNSHGAHWSLQSSSQSAQAPWADLSTPAITGGNTLGSRRDLHEHLLPAQAPRPVAPVPAILGNGIQGTGYTLQNPFAAAATRQIPPSTSEANVPIPPSVVVASNGVSGNALKSSAASQVPCKAVEYTQLAFSTPNSPDSVLADVNVGMLMEDVEKEELQYPTEPREASLPTFQTIEDDRWFKYLTIRPEGISSPYDPRLDRVCPPSRALERTVLENGKVLVQVLDGQEWKAKKTDNNVWAQASNFPVPSAECRLTWNGGRYALQLNDRGRRFTEYRLTPRKT